MLNKQQKLLLISLIGFFKAIMNQLHSRSQVIKDIPVLPIARLKRYMIMFSIPSSKSGIITISAELRESLSCLDIVWSDRFEAGDINPEEARNHETYFLKGAPLKWLNLAEEENVSGYVCNHGSLRVGNETLCSLGIAMGNAVSVTPV